VRYKAGSLVYENMKNHDPRCEGGSKADKKLLDDIAKYGWHVMMVVETPETPGWAYSVGSYKGFGQAEILVFGLDLDLMHYMINTIGEGVQQGKSFEVDERYADLIEAYQCTLKTVNVKWYPTFMGFASWFYEGNDYPVLQCFWPDFEGRYPWDPEFDQQLKWAQPLLFHEEPITARAEGLIGNLDLEVAC
jgi:hypothetical protein